MSQCKECSKINLLVTKSKLIEYINIDGKISKNKLDWNVMARLNKEFNCDTISV